MKLKTFEIRKAYCWLLLVLILFSFGCNQKSTSTTPTDNTVQITLFYTNDEHGWMEATDTHGGAAGMMGLWRQQEGYREDGPFLILSGGDMWTGPAISTWFKGLPMVEVMNAMHYNAAAIGNHEFDFQADVMRERLAQSNFPYLAANIHLKGTENNPDFATPFIIAEVNGVKVGLIGLTTLSTPSTAFPAYVEDYDFISYETALRDTVPQVREAGAQLLLVVSHLCNIEMTELAPTAAELGIALMGGGHCHETVTNEINDVVIIQSGSYFENYVRVDIVFNTRTNTAESIQTQLRPNQGGTPDAAVAAVVEKWKNETDRELSEVIGYTTGGIDKDSNEMANMITDSWLWAFPGAQIAITNGGGIRQSLDAGEISLADIVGILPFENSIIQLDLTGAQIKACLGGDLLVGGMTTINGYFLADGTPMDDTAIYRVLTTDYIFTAYDCFRSLEVEPEITGINWRIPVIDWIKSLQTSVNNPLEGYLDHEKRQKRGFLKDIAESFLLSVAIRQTEFQGVIFARGSDSII